MVSFYAIHDWMCDLFLGFGGVVHCSADGSVTGFFAPEAGIVLTVIIHA